MQGNEWQDVHIYFIITDNESQLVPTVACISYADYLIQHSGSSSMPSSLPHFAKSELFEHGHISNRHSVQKSPWASQKPAPLEITNLPAGTAAKGSP